MQNPQRLSDEKGREPAIIISMIIVGKVMTYLCSIFIARQLLQTHKPAVFNRPITEISLNPPNNTKTTQN